YTSRSASGESTNRARGGEPFRSNTCDDDVSTWGSTVAMAQFLSMIAACPATAAAASHHRRWTAPRHLGAARLSADLRRQFDLHRRVQRQRVDAHGRAGVLAGLAEDLGQQVARAVGDLRLAPEAAVALHEHPQAHDAHEAIPVAADRL